MQPANGRAWTLSYLLRNWLDGLLVTDGLLLMSALADGLAGMLAGFWLPDSLVGLPPG